MPCRMIEWVCPPQTSMIAQRRVVAAWIWSSSCLASSGSLNSSRYFMASPRFRRSCGGWLRRPACPRPVRTRRRTPPSRIPSRSNLASVCIADSSSSRWIANPTWTTTYSPTSASGMYCRQTSLRTPPKSTSAISVPSRPRGRGSGPVLPDTCAVLPSSRPSDVARPRQLARARCRRRWAAAAVGDAR